PRPLCRRRGRRCHPRRAFQGRGPGHRLCHALERQAPLASRRLRMTLAILAFWIVLALLAALAVFQAALALGAPLGHFAWGGGQRVLAPRMRIAILVAILLYALFALDLAD